VDRIGKVYFNKKFAGILKQTKNEYSFTYDLQYIATGAPLSFNLPLQEQPFRSNSLFPFFENLASEGWLKKIQSKAQKINENDKFELILENGKDMAGAVTILRSNNELLQNQP
jgi:serine/threonine-protein kinase HipA